MQTSRKRKAFKPNGVKQAPISREGFQLPASVFLDAVMLSGGEKVRFRYAESFGDLAVVRQSVQLVKQIMFALPGIKMKTMDRGYTVMLYGTVSRERFGDMMTGEFLHWGKLGATTLSDLLLKPLAVVASRPAVLAPTRKRKS